jgi:metal-responsive CopG/Arc/MetJ family transcriptional regulator
MTELWKSAWKAVISISIPLDLLNRIEDYAMMEKINRSEAIIRLVRHGLNYLAILEKEVQQQKEKGEEKESEKKD